MRKMNLKRKLATILLLLSLLVGQIVIIAPIVYAEEPVTGETGGAGADGDGDTSPPPAEGDGEDDGMEIDQEAGKESLDSFSVGTYLTIPGTGEEGSGQEQKYLKDDKYSPIVAFVLYIIEFLIKVVGTVSIALIMIGGLYLLSSEGDDNKIQKGKGVIMQAIIGLIIALTSYIIVSFVQSLLYVQS